MDQAPATNAGDCTFSLLAGPADRSFVETILAHLLRMCRYDFREVLVVVDDLPKPGAPPTIARDRAALLQLLDQSSLVSRVVPLSDVCRNREAVYRKYFGRVPSLDRDRRGIPLLGWAAGIEASRTDFVVHFDSDILLHQDAGHSWLTEGIDLIRRDPSALFVAPHPGPPAPDGALPGQRHAPTLDAAGNFRFKQFSSRRFLVDKHRLEAFLPTPLLYTSRRERLLMHLGFGNALQMWEECVSAALGRSSAYRVHLRSGKAWSVHCKQHGPEWLAALPAIIERVESGDVPPEQAGHYDLLLQHWLRPA